MSWYAKLFSQLWELDDDNKLRFSDFEKLNEFLERSPLLSYTDLFNSYVKIVLDIWKNPNFWEYSELDFQVKYLIDEVKVPLNKILNYARLKYWEFNDVLKWFFSNIPWIDEDTQMEIIGHINKRKTWSIVIYVKTTIDTPEEHIILFDLNSNPSILHKRLKECFDKINLERIKTWEIKWIWIWLK